MPRIHLGTISKKRIERVTAILKSLGSQGRFTIDPADGPRRCEIKLASGVRASFDAPYTVDYEFEGDLCRLTFADQMKVRWMFASVSVSEAVIDGSQILVHAGLLQAKLTIA